MDRKELIKKYVQRLKDRCHSGEFEEDHYFADEIICDLLKELGFDEVVEEYDKVGKWYS